MERAHCYLFGVAFLSIICRETNILATNHVTNLATDQSAILVLKAHITVDSRQILENNWSAAADANSVCSWIGVICGVRHNRVVGLNLSNMGLEGTIPPNIGNLSFLGSLNISSNKFYGKLPDELVGLRGLEEIDLTSNGFSGGLPLWFSSLPKLKSLLLGINGFTGTIPPSLGNISTLEVLRFMNNILEGGIPHEIGNLQCLQELRLDSNRLTGSIPLSIFNISTLRFLSFSVNNLSGYLPVDMCDHVHASSQLEGLALSFNHFSGLIPPSLYKCSKLRLLSLGGNNFSGPIPREMGNITQLKALYLGGINFGGVIPESIGNLYKLERLVLNNGGLMGNIPAAIFNISTLITFSAVDNQLSGTLPSNLGYRLLYLEELYLGMNNISGTIPEYISNASSLVRLDLIKNELTGVIPHSLGNLANLKYLNLEANYFVSDSRSSELSFLGSLTKCRQLAILQIGRNPLSGRLPASIGNFSTSLLRFNAHECGIKGELPNDVGNLSSLTGLHLASNELTGFIPKTVKELSNLQILGLSDNKLQGYIPNELCYLQKNLYGLSLRGNQLSGPVPSCFGNLTSIKVLYLESNMFSSLPDSMWNLKDLLQLDISSNSLTGKLPPEIGNLKVAVAINLSYNYFISDIPSTLGGIQSMIRLSLAHNRLQGSIPNTFDNLISLEVLDLSNNNLSGVIPKSLEKLMYLSSFNVCYNSLVGEIPSGGNFTNFTFQSFMSNKALCGALIFQVPPCKTSSSHRSREIKMVVLRYIFPGVVFLLLGALVYFLVRWRNSRRVQVKTNDLPIVALQRIQHRVLVIATDGFSESNLLGSGSFGSVYKGVLSDGMIVAVKVFKLPLESAIKSFDTECEVIRNIRHRNLTRVITSCTNLDFRALVLEYMPNGNLERWLYSHNYLLDISQRLGIMIDVAAALDYLHHEQSMPVVHCDLKPSNILLDEDMVAHVSDFGIAKVLLSDMEYKAHTQTHGTIGYVAPEVGQEGLVNMSSDVYSYGIMLMETFTRMKPTDEMFSGDMNLRRWVNESLPDNINLVIDVNLLEQEEEHFSAKVDCVSSILQLALQCSAESRAERVNMSYVLPALKKIHLKFMAYLQVNNNDVS